MTIRNRRVYSIEKENEVLKKSIIQHTSYKKNGYAVTHFSMDTQTISSPERICTPVLVISTSGMIRMTILQDGSKKEKLLKQGQCYLRPSNTFAYYKAEETRAIATEVKLRNNSVITEILKEDQIYDLDQLVEYIPHQRVSHYLIKDDKFCIKVKSYSELTEDEGVSNIPFITTLLEGSIQFRVNQKEYHLNPNQSLFVNKEEPFAVTIAPNTKIVIVYLDD